MSELEGLLAEQARYYRERAGEYDDWWFRRLRRLADGREYQIVKRFHEPGPLQQRLAGLGWSAQVQATSEFFIYTGIGRPVVSRRMAYPALISTLVASDSSLLDMVEAVRALPYARPSERSVEGMLRDRRGTCSTKHLFLAQALAERFPETEPLIVHRVYRLDRARAAKLFGAAVAEVVPEGGLVDVHRYLTIVVDDRRINVDATFPGTPWDGRSSLPLACGPGRDYPACEDPDAEKRALEAKHCDPEVREPFIGALASVE